MKTLIKVMLFSLGLTLLFTLVANLLPQVEGEATIEEALDLGGLTMEGFISLGESIFKGKGTCTLCHNSMGRAPDILNLDMVATGSSRLQDTRYQGEASDAESYLRESMRKPSAFVVAGFGKKGSNDTESPMPVVTNAPIQLTDIEINAVIAFLQSKDGNNVTVALPTDAPAITEAPKKVAAPKNAATPEEAITKYQCVMCHSILNSEAPVGPSLRTVGSRLTKSQIRDSVLDPMAVIAEGFPPAMPPNIAENMSVKELELIVSYLSEQKKSEQKTAE